MELLGLQHDGSLLVKVGSLMVAICHLAFSHRYLYAIRPGVSVMITDCYDM
jgi:hypothetical protein